MKKIYRLVVYSAVPLGTVFALNGGIQDRKTLFQVRRNLRTIFTSLDILHHYYWRTKGRDISQEAWNELHEYASTKMLRLFQRNGGVYIKFGQHLASLDYLVPAQFCDKMKILFQQAPVSPQCDVDAIIKEELSATRDEIFSTFEPVPLGAASLAQVHAATLRETGERVAVKVQHRSLLQSVENDIKLSSFLFGKVKYLFPDFQFDWLAEEMRANLPLEMDFVNEANNAKRMRQHLAELEDLVIVPKTFDKYSSKRVLTMELMEGFSITDTDSIKKYKVDEKKVFNCISDMVCRMIFKYQLLHCDPHPGNVLIVPMKNDKRPTNALSLILSHLDRFRIFNLMQTVCKPQPKWKIALLDHGLYRELSDSVVSKYADFWHDLLFFSEEGLRNSSKALGISENNFRIFSAMLSQSTWSFLSNCPSVLKPHLENVHVLRQKSIQHFPSIVQVLSTVPRELLLVFKTNDIVRSLERKLTHSPTPCLYLQNTLDHSFRYRWRHRAQYSLWQNIQLLCQYFVFKCTCLIN